MPDDDTPRPLFAPCGMQPVWVGTFTAEDTELMVPGRDEPIPFARVDAVDAATIDASTLAWTDQAVVFRCVNGRWVVRAVDEG